jgi:hypothetical protein
MKNASKYLTIYFVVNMTIKLIMFALRNWI